ncbi:MAG: contractile injection system tape measure protein [Pseudomonadota bacterium]
MASPARKTPTLMAPARIGLCQAEFDVGAPNGPLSSPEKLLAAVRQELLPALSEVLDDPEMQALEIDAPLVEIDLGTWPDDPTWPEVRYVLALKLRQALAAYGHRPASGRTATQSVEPESNRTHSTPSRPKPANNAAAVPVAVDQPSPDASKERRNQSADSSEHPAADLEDAVVSKTLAVFAEWLNASAAPRETAEILAHLAGRPALKNALRLWHLAPLKARQAVLPVPQAQQQAVSDAVERLGPQGPPRQARSSEAAPASPIYDPSQAIADPQADLTRLTRLQHLLASGSTPEADHLRRAAHWLATWLHRSGAEADTAQDHAVRLMARLRSDPDLAKALSSPSVSAAIGSLSDSQTAPAGSASPDKLPVAPGQEPPRSEDSGARVRGDTDVDARTDAHAQRGGKTAEGAFGTAVTSHDAEDPAREVPPLRALAAAITAQDKEIPAGPVALRQVVAQAFAERPAPVFEAAEALGQLPELATALQNPAVAEAALIGEQALSAPQIVALHVADRGAIPRAMASIAPPALQQLVNRLLPHSARLLSDQITDLARQAKHPAHALERVVLALLENRPMDLEHLRTAEPDAPDHTQPPRPAPSDLHGASGSTDPLPGSEDSRPARDQTETGRTPPADAPQGGQFPLRALLALSGLEGPEIDRVTTAARPQTQVAPGQQRDNRTHMAQDGPAPSDGADATLPDPPAKSATGTPPPVTREHDRPIPETRTRHDPFRPGRSDTELRAHLEKLASVTAPTYGQALQDMLTLIWSVWPERSSRQPEPGTPLPAAKSPARDLVLLTARLTAHAAPTNGSLAELLDAALPVFEPDTDRRIYAMRTALARLASLTGPDVTGLRASTRAALEYQLSPAPPEETPPRPATPLKTTSTPFAEETSDEETFHVTENAGLVLLHPFYPLLFDRLKIDRDGKALAKDHLPRALGALQFLAGDTAQNDPLHRVLLGLDAAQPMPEPVVPDDEASTLMDGLLRSVIERWGRLGATSPDGLRQTFLCRTGTLRHDATGARLRVTPGPFDMLLDGLPWSPGPVTLPWMPLPCYVSWREDEDA